MFRRAVSEVRFHPTRFVAVLFAIAMSVGFIVASQVAVITEMGAMAKSSNAQFSKADLVVGLDYPKDVYPANPPEKDWPKEAEMRRILGKVPGVVAQPSQNGSVVLGRGADAVFLGLAPVPAGPSLRWYGVLEGREPQSANEVMIGRDVAQALGIKVGDSIESNAVSGTDKTTFVVSGLNDAPKSRTFNSVGVAANQYFVDRELEFAENKSDYVSMNQWLIGVDGDVAAVQEKLTSEFKAAGFKYVSVAVPFEKLGLTQGFFSQVSPFSMLALLFGGISLVVGSIIISSTFSILFAQRKRQIALLRAVGATGDQVRRQLFFEAAVIGFAGSVLGAVLGIGCAYVAESWTGAVYWNFVVPWGVVLVSVVLGVLVTVLSAYLPAIAATRVAPVEALLAVPTQEQARRVSMVRAVGCALSVAVGAGLAVWAVAVAKARESFDGSATILTLVGATTGAGVFISFGVLFAAPLYIPWLLRLFGVLLHPFGPTARMAAKNALRNPRRSSATATALMLAIGLIITLQVTGTTGKELALSKLEEVYPVDLVLKSQPEWKNDGSDQVPIHRSLKPETIGRFKAVPGIKASVSVTTGMLVEKLPPSEVPHADPPLPPAETEKLQYANVEVARADPRMQLVFKSSFVMPKPGEIIAGPNNNLVRDTSKPQDKKGDYPVRSSFTIKDQHGVERTFRVRIAPVDNTDVFLMSPADFDAAIKDPKTSMVWALVGDRSKTTAVFGKIVDELGAVNTDEFRTSGSLIESAQIEKIVDLLLLIVSGLLGVSILIALLGVGNTLGLSVIERRRESGLMRALGLQKSQLRLMLAIEAFLLSLSGVLIGAVFGGFFAWLGVRTVASMVGIDSPVFLAVSWRVTGSIILLTMLAGVLSSVLPGIRASRATPVEALADIG